MIIDKDLINILTYSQKELRAVIERLKAPKHERIITSGAVIYKPLDVEQSAFICTHLDTINDAYTANPPSLSELEISKDLIRLKPPASCKCLGGDDRCGVYIAIKLLLAGSPLTFGFFRDEEVGCLGSKEAADYIDSLNLTCFVGLDRKGFNECAVYGYDNKELIELFKEWGYNKEQGSITDASNLSALSAFDLACVNLSVGYYHEHRKGEFIIPSAVERTLRVMWDLEIVTALNSKVYKAEPRASNPYAGFYYDPYYADNGGFYADDYLDVYAEEESKEYDLERELGKLDYYNDPFYCDDCGGGIYGDDGASAAKQRNKR